MTRLFHRRTAPPPVSDQTIPKKTNWLKISIYANVIVIALAVLFAAGGVIVVQSNTNPNLCGLCHVMQKNVESYMTGKNLDSVHHQANVQCKDCHDYPLTAEISTGVNYLIGNYSVTKEGTLPKRKFDDAMCLKCHISPTYLANQTDFLVRNPHFSHWGDLKCSDCHVSHGQQVNLCAECHDSGGQRMTGGEIYPRAENPWADPNRKPPDTTLPAQGSSMDTSAAP